MVGDYIGKMGLREVEPKDKAGLIRDCFKDKKKLGENILHDTSYCEYEYDPHCAGMSVE